MAPAIVPSVAGLPLHQAGTKGDLGSYVIPQRFARSQEVILNSHQRESSFLSLPAVTFPLHLTHAMKHALE